MSNFYLNFVNPLSLRVFVAKGVFRHKDTKTRSFTKNSLT
jgi:hypothetical protein